MLSWLCGPCKSRASVSGEVGPLDSLDASRRDRTLLLISGTVMERALLGDLLKIIAERKMAIVAMKMGKDEQKIDGFINKRWGTPQIADLDLQNPFVVAIVQKNNAVSQLPAILAQFRVEHGLDAVSVFSSENSKGVNRDVAYWFSVEELQTKPTELAVKNPDDHPLEIQNHEVIHEEEEPSEDVVPIGDRVEDELSETNPFHEPNGAVHDHDQASTQELVREK
ncbi:hypothetical protein L596_007642 [Steinernema carpocapsae]|uniref:Uncharacterized protein n=1 Tax=Steinernema carpocapsae TaxID=34508 RepID=A0A4U5PA20_STECR|nr:hypothetical protein L596_007642 [Steinernema carpocapsae]